MTKTLKSADQKKRLKLEHKIFDIFTKVYHQLGCFEEWDVRLIYSYRKNPDGIESYAECSARWEYQDALITCFPKNLKQKTDKEIEEIMLHELLHVCLNEMWDWEPTEKGQKHEERVCQMLTRAFLNASNKGIK